MPNMKDRKDELHRAKPPKLNKPVRPVSKSCNPHYDGAVMSIANSASPCTSNPFDAQGKATTSRFRRSPRKPKDAHAASRNGEHNATRLDFHFQDMRTPTITKTENNNETPLLRTKIGGRLRGQGVKGKPSA
jgi:hypothetical protein